MKEKPSPPVHLQGTTMLQLALELEELPGELRSVIARHVLLPDALEHLAFGTRQTLDEITGRSSAAELRQAATLLRSQVQHGERLLSDLGSFAGWLEGLAWVAAAQERAENG
jgi:hypothetical protein